MTRKMWLLAGALFAASPGLSASDVLSPELADSFHQKILAVVQHANAEVKSPRTTPIAEGELNSYLRFRAGDQLPSGVTDPAVTLIGEGRVAARAVVDLDVIRQKQSKGSWFDPTSYLTGKIPITTTGDLQTNEGVAHFALERVEVSGVPMPKRLLQEIVSYYTKSADYPNGISLDEGFTLPAQIRRLDVEAGRAIVVQ